MNQPLPPHIAERIRQLAVKQKSEQFPWMSYGLFYVYAKMLQEAAQARRIADTQVAYWYWDGIPWTHHRAVFTEIAEVYEVHTLYEASYLYQYGRV